MFDTTPRPLVLSLGLAFALSATACASMLERAHTSRDAENYEKAEKQYRKAMAKGGSDATVARRELADMKIDVGKKALKSDPARAEVLFREALQIDPDSETGQDSLGRAAASQGRLDEAISILSPTGEFGPCELCGRYRAVLLVKRAKIREQAGDNEGAKADYTAALKLIPQATTGFDLVALLMASGNQAEAADVLEQTIPLIREDDSFSQEQFVALREQVVSEASRSGKLELADRYMKMFPPGSGGDAWYTLHLRLAREQRRRGDFDGALARVNPLLGPDHSDTLSPTRRTQFTKFVAGIHKTRGSGFLTSGKVTEAETELREGLRLTPEDTGFKLMMALVLAGKGQVDNALKIVESVPQSARGHDEVVAVLESMKVHTLLTAGDLEAAELALARAQTASNEAPETHLAAAEILAATPVAGLSRKTSKLLKKKGTLRFPDNEVNRYGEALSEVSWARTQVKNQGDKYLFRGPNFNRDIDAFERRLHQFYPFAVEFNEDATTVLELVGKTGGYDVKLRGPNDVSEAVFVGSGKKSSPVTLIVPGLVTIKYGKRTMMFVSEPYTKLTIEL